ncbi:MAG TPA: helix-turn-helix domain-containing protein [Methylomirabilota bacterium]|nr:helix-turn-helix domain-containing protein [Methylomirabilota bacterium]
MAAFLSTPSSMSPPPGTPPKAGDGFARPAPGFAQPAAGFHGAVSEFKRRLIEATLAQVGGNRTRAARVLGLQRTYLLRLIREFQVRVPPAAAPPRRAAAPAPSTPAQTR